MWDFKNSIVLSYKMPTSLLKWDSNKHPLFCIKIILIKESRSNKKLNL